MARCGSPRCPCLAEWDPRPIAAVPGVPLPGTGSGEGFGSRTGPCCQAGARGQGDGAGSQLLVPTAGAGIGGGDATGPAVPPRRGCPCLEPGPDPGCAQRQSWATMLGRSGAEGSGCTAVAAGHSPLAGTRSSPGVTAGREELGGCAGSCGAAAGAAAVGLTPPQYRAGGFCLFSCLFKPFPFLCARCFLLSKSGTASPAHVRAPLRHRDPQLHLWCVPLRGPPARPDPDPSISLRLAAGLCRPHPAAMPPPMPHGVGTSAAAAPCRLWAG